MHLHKCSTHSYLTYRCKKIIKFMIFIWQLYMHLNWLINMGSSINGGTHKIIPPFID